MDIQVLPILIPNFNLFNSTAKSFINILNKVGDNFFLCLTPLIVSNQFDSFLSNFTYDKVLIYRDSMALYIFSDILYFNNLKNNQFLSTQSKTLHLSMHSTKVSLFSQNLFLITELKVRTCSPLLFGTPFGIFSNPTLLLFFTLLAIFYYFIWCYLSSGTISDYML